ncbi:retrovirus-related pol polyprotein from transposon TNT 1-94 [Tanacetum coccineum]
MVNTSLKELKRYLTGFDQVVKERTTATAITEGTWGFEHTKACFRDEIIPFIKELKDIFNNFNQYLVEELADVQKVFKQKDTSHVQVEEQIKALNGTNVDDHTQSKWKWMKLRLFNIELEHRIASGITGLHGQYRNKGFPQTPSSNSKNKVEAHPRNVKSSLNKRNGTVKVNGSASVQNSKKQDDSDYVCVNSDDCMSSDNLCVSNSMNDVKFRAKPKKKKSKEEIWKPTGKVFTKMGYIWRPTGRTFTIVGNACPLTRITTTNEVPSRKPIVLESESPKPVVNLVYSRKPRKNKNTESVSKTEDPQTISANKQEPSKSWGSTKTNVPSTSLNECRLSKSSSGKSSKKPHKPKSEDTNQEKLYLLHMDLCGPMRVARSHGNEVHSSLLSADYSRFTWVKCLRSKDEAPAFIINFLKMIQVRLKETVCHIRTDNGTAFVNQTLREYYEKVGISHETSAARSPTAKTGYCTHEKAFKIYNKTYQTNIETIHVEFDELDRDGFLNAAVQDPHFMDIILERGFPGERRSREDGKRNDRGKSRKREGGEPEKSNGERERWRECDEKYGCDLVTQSGLLPTMVEKRSPNWMKIKKGKVVDPSTIVERIMEEYLKSIKEGPFQWERFQMFITEGTEGTRCYNASQENGSSCWDEEQCISWQGNRVTNVVVTVDDSTENDLALNVDHIFEADECDAFDSDVDEGPTSQTMFMASLTSEDPIYDEAGPSYDSNNPFEVQDHDAFVDHMDEYHDYVEDNEEHVVQCNASSVQSRLTNKPDMLINDSVTSELARYKELVGEYEKTGKSKTEEVKLLKKDFKQKEDKFLEEFLDLKKIKDKIEDRLYKQGQSAQTVHMLCQPKSFYDEKHKVAIGYKKQAQSAVYNGHMPVTTNHTHVIHDSAEYTWLELRKLGMECC